MFDLCWTLPKYHRTFLHENAVLMVGLTEKSYYSICHFLVRLYILTVHLKLYYCVFSNLGLRPKFVPKGQNLKPPFSFSCAHTKADCSGPNPRYFPLNFQSGEQSFASFTQLYTIIHICTINILQEIICLKEYALLSLESLIKKIKKTLSIENED